MFEVKVIEDSLSKAGIRLTTLQLKYWRGIHSEFLTHRMFSRNASSSRAIPVAKMIKQVRENPAMPIHWGKNISGMQAREENDSLVRIDLGNEYDLVSAKKAWQHAANQAADVAESMMEAGYHKQVVNRLLEPFQFIHVVVTATDWENFFELRCHPDAQPEISVLATMMRDAMNVSKPRLVSFGRWHMPYVSSIERENHTIAEQLKMSTARCARVSYMSHHGLTPNPIEDYGLYDRLVGGKPIHASPTEHAATPNSQIPHLLLSNFRGWIQNRKIIELNYAENPYY